MSAFRSECSSERVTSADKDEQETANDDADEAEKDEASDDQAASRTPQGGVASCIRRPEDEDGARDRPGLSI